MAGKDGYYRSGDVRLHYLAYGEGPPVVVVPGITSPAITWGFVAEQLADEYRLLVLDVRGRGLSDKPIHELFGSQVDVLLDSATDLIDREEAT